MLSFVKSEENWCLLCLGCWGNEAHEIILVKYLAQWLKNWHTIWPQLMPAIIIPPKKVLLISRPKYATANYSVRSLKDLKIYRCYCELIIFPPPWFLTLKMAIRFTQLTSDQTVSSDSSFINPFVQPSINFFFNFASNICHLFISFPPYCYYLNLLILLH